MNHSKIQLIKVAIVRDWSLFLPQNPKDLSGKVCLTILKGHYCPLSLAAKNDRVFTATLTDAA